MMPLKHGLKPLTILHCAMIDLEKWSPPKLSAVDKFPTVDILGDYNEYIRWFFSSGINPFIPPIYEKFVILFGEGKRVVYVEYLKMTQFRFCFYSEGKKKFFAQVDYENTAGNDWDVNFKNCSDDRTNEDNCFQIVRLVLAVQAYLLYHKPEVVPILTNRVQKNRNTSQNTEKKTSAAPPRKIKKQVKKYIYLNTTEEKALKDKTPRNYRAIQWQVRGFYRRQNYKGGKTRLIYIAPHSAKRGEKKLKNIKIIVE